MAKYVYLMRHAEQTMNNIDDIWQIEAPLVQTANNRIRDVAQYFSQQGICFSSFWHSSLVRSQQTCRILRDFMNSNARTRLNRKLGPGEVAVWNTRYVSWKQNQTDPTNPPIIGSIEIARLWPDLSEREGQRVTTALNEILQEINDHECAVAISHNPLIRLAEGLIQGHIDGPDPDYCQAILVVLNGYKLETQVLLQI